MRRPGSLILPVLAFALAGCFSLGRDTPSLEQYVLVGGTATAGTSGAQNATGLAVGVRRLDLAAYLASPAIVVRRGTHRIVVSEFHRWGEDPGEGINRAFAGYLAAAAPLRAVDVAPWPLRAQHDFLVQLHVSRFEGVAPDEPLATQGEAHVLASWEIIRPQDGAVVARGVTDHRHPGWTVGDYAGLVTLLDAGLAAVARDLVTCMESLASAPRPAGDVEPVPGPEPALACAPRRR